MDVGRGLDTPEEAWATALEVNVMAHVRAARLLLPGWLDRGSGHLICTVSAAGLVWPVGGPVVSGFGWRWGRMHQGDDFGTPVGTPLAAMSSGKVTFAGWQGGYGNKIEITYWDGTVSVFGHMSQIATSVGQSVAPGDIVGYSGNTGHSTGPHLHLEIHPGGGDAIDPAPWLRAHHLQ